MLGQARFALRFVAVMLLSACGKDEGQGAGPVSPEDLPTRVAKIQCESLGGCCKEANHAFDVATCTSLVAAAVARDLDSESEAVNTRYDAEAAADCLADYAAHVVCGDVEGDLPACQRLIDGTLPLGAACDGSYECAQPRAGGPARCEGVCVVDAPPLRGKLGDTCNLSCENEEQCLEKSLGVSAPVACYRSDGLACPYASAPDTTVTCQPLLALGERCAANQDCVAGAVCSIASTTCILQRKTGEACDSYFECASGYCNGACISARPSFSADDCLLN